MTELDKRNKVVAAARGELGNAENPPNSNNNKYGEWYGLNGFPWCAMFVSWCFDKADIPLGNIDDAKGYRYCPSAFLYWKHTQQLTSTPKIGDIVLFDWEGDGKCDHTGIFIKDNGDGNTFTAIEGNTSNNNNSNGGQVMERKRHYSLVKAFVNPACYGQTQTPNDPILFKKGDKGSDVANMQKKLYDLGYPIVVDGDFGNQTLKGVKNFQADHSKPTLGKVTASLLGLMDELLRLKTAPNTLLTTGSYLNPGSSGMAVRLLQEALNKAGMTPKLIADGIYGPSTKKAVLYFQRSQGLEMDGIAGPQTLKKLKLAL